MIAIDVADALGYTGTISVMRDSDLAEVDVSRLDFFRGFSHFMSGLGTVLLLTGCTYFLRRSRAPAES